MKITVIGYRNATLWNTVYGLQKLGYHVGVRLLCRNFKRLPQKAKSLCLNRADPGSDWEILLAPAAHAPTPGKKTIFVPSCIRSFPAAMVSATLNRAAHVIVPSSSLAGEIARHGVKTPITAMTAGAKQLANLLSGMVNDEKARVDRGRVDQVCVVILGKFGDIINILPVCKAIYDRDGRPPALMVAKEFRYILEGVSYVTPEIFDGDFRRINDALKFARQKFKSVVVGQIYGGDHINTRDSFNAEAWGAAGYAGYWGRLPLEFDRRNLKRERLLLDRHLGAPRFYGDKPMLLFNGAGETSPFVDAAEVLADIRARWEHKFDIVDLAMVKAHRLFDLIGFYSRAVGLITIDTATLHLAWATPRLKVFAFVSDRDHPWQGSRPPRNCVSAVRYREVLDRREEIHDFISKIEGSGLERFFHVTCETQSSPDAARRNLLARESWQKAYKADGRWRPIPILPRQLPRVFADKDRTVPHIKDLLDFTASFANDQDFLVFTNSDIGLSSGAAKTLGNEIVQHQIGFGNRREFYRKLSSVPRVQALGRAELLYGGVDMFVFPVWWWKKHRQYLPDMVIGSETWDLVYREYLLEVTGGTAHRWLNHIFHEQHHSFWLREEHRFSLPSRLHNVELASKFYQVHGKGYDHAFVINLDKRTDRLAQVTPECARVGISFERMPAVFLTKGLGKMRASKTACRLSHLSCIKEAKARGYWSVLVLEDDACFTPDFRREWRAIVVELERYYWDIFLIGCQHFGPPNVLSPRIAEAKSFSLGHAYIVHSRAYDKVIKVKSNRNKPNDLALSDACAAGDLKALMAFPVLAMQRESWSDNDQRTRRWEIRGGTCVDPDWTVDNAEPVL